LIDFCHRMHQLWKTTQFSLQNLLYSEILRYCKCYNWKKRTVVHKTLHCCLNFHKIRKLLIIENVVWSNRSGVEGGGSNDADAINCSRPSKLSLSAYIDLYFQWRRFLRWFLASVWQEQTCCSVLNTFYFTYGMFQINFSLHWCTVQTLADLQINNCCTEIKSGMAGILLIPFWRRV